MRRIAVIALLIGLCFTAGCSTLKDILGGITIGWNPDKTSSTQNSDTTAHDTTQGGGD